MRSQEVVPGQQVTAEQYNSLRKDAAISSWLLAHQKTVPDMQLYVEPGQIYIDGRLITFAGGNSPTFTPPVTNPRIDVLSIDATGALVRTAGSESVTPIAPNVPPGNMPICQVYNKVGQLSIRDADATNRGYILKDTRPVVAQWSTVMRTFTMAAGVAVTALLKAVFLDTDGFIKYSNSGAAATQKFIGFTKSLVNYLFKGQAVTTQANGTTSYTYAYTAPAGIDRVVVITLGQADGNYGTSNCGGVTVAGVAATRVDTFTAGYRANGGGAAGGNFACFIIPIGSSDTPQTKSIVFSGLVGDSTTRAFAIACYEYIDQTTPVQVSASGGGTDADGLSAALNITNVPAEVIMAMKPHGGVESINNSLELKASQVDGWGIPSVIYSRLFPTAGSTTFTSTWAANFAGGRGVVFALNKSAAFSADILVQHSGILGGFTGLTPGAVYYVGATDGAITTTAPATPTIIGKAVSATEILITH